MTQILTSSFAKNIKHATYCKIANQQHQQNPVNELSCSNLYALVLFSTNKYMRFLFMVHGVDSSPTQTRSHVCISFIFEKNKCQVSLFFLYSAAMEMKYVLLT